MTLTVQYDQDVLCKRAVKLCDLLGIDYDLDGWAALLRGTDKTYVFDRKFLSSVRGFETPRPFKRFDVSELKAGDIIEVCPASRHHDRRYFQAAEVTQEYVELVEIDAVEVARYFRNRTGV